MQRTLFDLNIREESKLGFSGAQKQLRVKVNGSKLILGINPIGYGGVKVSGMSLVCCDYSYLI